MLVREFNNLKQLNRKFEEMVIICVILVETDLVEVYGCQGVKA